MRLSRTFFPAHRVLKNMLTAGFTVLMALSAVHTLAVEDTHTDHPSGLLEQIFFPHVLNLAQANQGAISADSVGRGIRNLMGQGISQRLAHALSNYGQAHVDISFDKEAGLRGRLDWLVPIYENQQRLFFTQIGLGREAHSTLLNFSLGQRHVGDQWMWGYNTFFDADVKRGYLSGSVGAEMWRDYLKMSGNFYFPLSGWSALSEVFLDARPARGYDFNWLGYLPFYPQLGGKIKYERYIGSNVSLVESADLPNHFYRNPQALTVGVNYTPVPLLTFSIDRRFGAATENETRAGIRFNLQLDQSIQKQSNPAHVKAMRSLASNRYDTVERNHSITLEYRQDLIQAILPDRLLSDSQAMIPFNLIVKSKYPISTITWVGSAVSACGLPTSCISGANGAYTLISPTYNAHSANQYQLQAQIHDQRGNAVYSNVMMVAVASPLIVTPLLTLQSNGDKVFVVGEAAQSFDPILASGGTPSYVFSIVPELPAGLVMDTATGAISGAALAASPLTNYQVTVTDQAGVSANTRFSLAVHPAPLVIVQSVDDKVLMTATATSFAPVGVNGGTPSYTFRIAPSLPVGLTLDSTTGVISGQVLVANPLTNYQVTITDSAGASVTSRFNLTFIAPSPPPPPLLVSESLGDKVLTATVASSSFFPIAVSGGVPSYTFSIAPALPTGLTMNVTTGQISGQALAASPLTNYVVTVTDSAGGVATSSFNLQINPPPLAVKVLQRNTMEYVNVDYQVFWPVRVVAGTGTPPYTLSVVPALPNGLTMDSVGRISGIPTVVTPRITYTFTATDATGATASQTFTLIVQAW